MSVTLAEAKKFPRVRVVRHTSSYRGQEADILDVDSERQAVRLGFTERGLWFSLHEVEAIPEPHATTPPLPTVYVIRGPVSGELSQKAREIYAQNPAVTYLLGAYFNRPDGRFAYNPDELENAVEFLSRRVRNFLDSGLGKSLIIDGVPGWEESGITLTWLYDRIRSVGFEVKEL